MRLLAFLAAFLMASLTAAQAQSVTFGGERYSQKYRQNVNAAHSYVELVRDGDSLQGWTTLVTLHAFPRMQDPTGAAAALVKTVRQRDRSTPINLITNPATGEAMLDFLAFKGDLVEFNLFKYAPAAGGQGVVAVQFAERFRLGEFDANDVKQLRQRAVNEMAGFDVGPARAAFAR
jgi:hypothetical protein